MKPKARVKKALNAVKKAGKKVSSYLKSHDVEKTKRLRIKEENKTKRLQAGKTAKIADVAKTGLRAGAGVAGDYVAVTGVTEVSANKTKTNNTQALKTWLDSIGSNTSSGKNQDGSITDLETSAGGG